MIRFDLSHRFVIPSEAGEGGSCLKLMLPGHGLQEYDAYMLLSVAGDVEIMQIVDPMYTIVAKIKKSLLPELK